MGREEGSKKMKIAIIHPDLGIGNRLIVDAVVELASHGHKVHVFTSHHDQSRCFEATLSGVFQVTVYGSFLSRHIFYRLNFLSINRFEKKKNINLAVSAFAILCKHKQNLTDVALTVAGKCSSLFHNLILKEGFTVCIPLFRRVGYLLPPIVSISWDSHDSKSNARMNILV
ncbi:unnamed protein product [Brassica rapa subsp. narinosa]